MTEVAVDPVTRVLAASPPEPEIIIPTATADPAVKALVDEPAAVLLFVVLRLTEQTELMPETANALVAVAAEEAPATAPKSPELTDNDGDTALPRIAAYEGSN